MFENLNFLKKKYNLHNAPETESAVRRAKTRGEKVPQTPEAKIQAYLDRLERLALDPQKEQPKKMIGHEPRPRALSLLREIVMKKCISSKKEKMTQGAVQVGERVARELGFDDHYGEEQMEQLGEITVTDLEKSLDQWISYLSDANEPYPVWFRYYAFRNIIDLGDYDKDKGEFTNRSQGSTRLFPDIDRGALAYVEQMIEAAKDPAMIERLQRAQREAANGNIPQDQLITQEKAESFAKLSFAKQYAEAIKQAGEITPEMRAETRGKWVKYQQGTDPTALWASLQNKGTPWCTKGFGTAQTQLEGGDFYVYYTLDKQGNATIPRLAIRMEGHDRISPDVRGVADSQQNVEGNMMEILDEKLKEFGPEAERFKKASADTKMLTAIYNKSKQGESLTKDELVFLYEINQPIEGFGYDRHPRIKELRSQRDPNQDAPIVFECEPSQIAHKPEEITEDTRAYIGPLFNGVFQTKIEHIGTSFPEGMVKKMECEVGGKTAEKLIQELEAKNIWISYYAKDMMAQIETSENSEQLKLVSLTVKDLGFPKAATINEIYKRAKELGLKLCPAETGPNLRLQNSTPDWMLIGMEKITDRDVGSFVFYLNLDRYYDRLTLNDYRADIYVGWNQQVCFLFSQE